jgi:hypothetical protein
MRALLAFVFTAFQVIGLWWSNPGMESSVGWLGIGLLIICLTPLTYLVQNLLFIGAEKLFGGRVLPESAQDADSTGERKAFLRHLPPAPALKSCRAFWCAFAVIMLGFLIPFATYYPAIMAYDVIPQLDQIKLSGYTTHHPLIHTLFLAGCLKAGELLPFVSNADRAGLAIYSLLQMSFMAGAFSYVYVFLRKRNVNFYICCFYVLCVAFFPTHGMLAVSITKDSLYAVLVMLFTVMVYEAVTMHSLSTRWLAAYLAVTVLLLLFRNNSIYAWILFLIVYAVAMRKNRNYKKMMGTHIASFLLYFIINLCLVQLSGATSATYAREMLSVPTQQIARVIEYHGDELSAEDYEKIEKVWGEDNLPEYVPAIADRSKRDISGDREELETLAGLWADLGLRYPGEYVKAFLLKSKGMWYLGDTSYLFDVYSYAKGYLQITYPSDQQEYMDALLPGYHRHQKLQLLQAFYRYFAASDVLWRYIPVLALVMQPAFYCWLLFYYAVICIGMKRYQRLVPVIYLAALCGTLLLGPCVLVRYVYPIMLSVTVLVLADLGHKTN